jgi:2-oxoisovalerate dehydrogenase E1 component
LALKPNIKGLLAEIMGHPTGICAGRGGSQHICDGRFFSNGIRGRVACPFAAGCALAEAMRGDSEAIATAFIGDGTLGQGVLYESLNLAAKWSLPWLIVLEHNGYAQSTNTATTIARRHPTALCGVWLGGVVRRCLESDGAGGDDPGVRGLRAGGSGSRPCW